MSSHKILFDIFDAGDMYQPADPGSAGTLRVDRSPTTWAIKSAGAEARTLAAPTKPGAEVLVYVRTSGGTVTLTVTGGYNEDGDTTFSFTEVGQYAKFEAIETAVGTLVWRKTSDYMTGNVTATELGYLSGVTAGTSAASKAVVTDSSGNVAFTGRLTTTDGVSSGTARVVGGLAYSNVAASASVGGTSVETLFDQSYTIPANTLKAGTVVKIRYAGFGVTGVGTDTFGHKLYIGGSGGTALITSAAAQLATNATFTGETTLICRTAGATGTFAAFGTYKQSSAEGTMTVKDDIVRSTTINTTANQAVVVTGTWNNANATSAILDVLTVEIY